MECYTYINIVHRYTVPYTKYSILKLSCSNCKELFECFGSYQKYSFCRIYKENLIIQF